jgi:predicted nucleic acid-binding protein
MSSIAYLDTCVWLSILFSNDPNHSKAMQVLQDIRNGKYQQTFISHHVLAEIFDVLKKQVAIANPSNPTKFQTLTRTKFQGFILRILQLPNVILKNPNASSDLVLRPSFVLLTKYLGTVKKTSNCPVCNSKFSFIEHDAIYEPDALHALVACNLNCDIFITFDKDFIPLKNDPKIAPMSIQVM